MLLITEENNDVKTSFIEESNGVKSLFIEGIFAQAELKNRNGRIYSSSLLDREMNRYIKEQVNTKRSLGELEHPQSPSIDPLKVSHLITELKKDGNDWVGKAKVLNTPMGNIVKGIIEGGASIGISTRGLGSVKSVNGINEVQNDFKLITADIVTAPSGIDCWINGILEGVDFGLDGQVVEVVRKKIMKAPRRRLQEEKLMAFEAVIKGMKL